MPQRTGIVATVIESNIIASNGYINVIDKVLEPVEAMLPEDYPDLETFFSNHSEYSIFAGWLKDKNLTDKMENFMNSYTLFVPSNEVAKTINRTVTTDYLRFYIAPKILMMASWGDNMDNTIVTDLGYDHQLVTEVKGWNKYTVNDVPVVKADMFTYGGIVNEIGGLLHPVLHECDEKNTTVNFGPCTVCSQGSVYPCLGGDVPVPGKGPFDCMYTEHYRNFYGLYDTLPKRKGCQGLCLKQNIIKGCCSGYFGKDCQECPSGPEFPCNGHGVCNDGIYGDGTCKCDPKFQGEQCDTCLEGWTGENCDIDMTSCSYKNGGCHSHADCYKASKITCTCWPGFRGDGYNCSGLCDIDNGGCHRNATCQYIRRDNIKCECKEGLVGNGRTNCNSDIVSSLVNIEQTTWFRKSLLRMTNKTLLSNLKSSYSTDQFTLFVPIDKGMEMKTLPESSILQQIVVHNSPRELTVLSPIDFNNITMTTMSKQTITITYNTTMQSFFVNDTKIISGNIAFTNGLVHIVEKPFTPPSEESESSGSLSVGAILGLVAALIIIAVFVVIGIFVYRRSQVGYWQVLQSWIIKRRDSEVANQETPLHVDDDDECRASVSGLPPHRDASFGNPLYQSEDL
ncbi:stabilin-2-like [Ruditapes philippinarum]|uniref:stabilin-2-like n=1 Tax=Ruditapes philippinarum TaxID=129788 RepID=UPI00295B43BA|nr:stabilin-2-like [Ruditapes philippinarum]